VLKKFRLKIVCGEQSGWADGWMDRVFGFVLM
jgi:hypothetical protein